VVDYLAVSILIALLGAALIIVIAARVLPEARARRLAERKSHEIGSPEDLEDFIRRVDQATSDDDLDRLDDQKKEDS
jgi:hypothetical protein